MSEANKDESDLSALLCLEHGEAIANLFFDSWMDEGDKNEFIRLFKKETGVSMEKINKDICTGIKNGYSVVEQLSVLKKMMA